MNDFTLSLPCKKVGKELIQFLKSQRTLSKRSFSRALTSLGISPVNQALLNLKYNFDNQLRAGSIYLPFFNILDKQLVTYAKFTDKETLEFFETSSSDLNLLFCVLSPIFPCNTHQSTYIFVKDPSELFIINKILTDLNLTNVFCILFLGSEIEIVHEQFSADNFLYFNFESMSDSLNLNIIGLNKINYKKVKSQFLSLILNQVKANKGIT